MPAVPVVWDEAAPATHLQCMCLLYMQRRLALVTDSARDLGQFFQLFQQPLFLLAGLWLLFRGIHRLLQGSPQYTLWRGTDTTFYKTLSHLINLHIQDCNLSWLPTYFHYCDLLWLILTNWCQSTRLVCWLPTLSSYSDDCSLISDQSLCDLTCCITNKLTCLLLCLTFERWFATRTHLKYAWADSYAW